MTRIKFFTVILLAVLGGFILSAPSESWAAENNKEVQHDVSSFVKTHATKAKDKQGEYMSKSKILATKRSDLDNKIKTYETARDAVLDSCRLSRQEGMAMREAKAKDAYAKAVAAAKKRNQAVSEGDFMAAILKDLEVTGHNIEEGYQWVRYAWNWVGGGQVGDSFFEWWETSAKEAAIKFFAENKYAYTAQVSWVEAQCLEYKRDGAKLPQDFSTKISNLQKQASELETLYYDKDVLEASGYGDQVYQHCYKQKNEQMACILFIVGENEDKIMTIAGASAGCPPLPYKVYEAKSCLFCPLFKVIYNAVDKASAKAYSTLGRPLSNLVLIGLSIWIALMVLSNVSAMTKQDAPKFLNDLFRASFKVVIIFLLLRNSQVVYEVIIGPLLKSGFEFGASFLERSGNIKKCADALATSGGASSKIFPAAIYTNLLCFIEAIQSELSFAQAIGSSLMCISVNQGMSNLGPLAKVFPDFSMMLQGALIYIIAFILSLAFGFYLIDATIQLGIFGMLLPFLLLCWPFKVTNSYFGKGVGVFMNSWFIYVFMGIVVNMSITLIGQGLTGGKGGLDAVETAINGSNVQKLQELLGIGFSGFLVLVACCVFGVKLMMKVQDLAGTFSGGGLSLGIGNKIGGLAAAAGTGVAKNTVGLAGRMGKSALNAKIFEGKNGQYHSVADGLSALKSKAGRAVGRGMQGTGRAAGKAIGATGHAIGTVASTPVRIMRAAMRGLNRRQP